MSLRRRMHGLVAAAVLPLVLLLVWDSYKDWRDLQEAARREALASAQLVAGNVDGLIEGARQLASAIARRMQESGSEEATCSAYLRSIVANIPRYFGASVLDPNGTVRCTTVPVPPGFTIADRAYFRSALMSKDLVVGEVVTGRAVGRPSLPVAMAFRDSSERVEGVVVLALNLEGLAGILAERFPAARGYAMVVDHNGIAAARAPDHAQTVGRPATPELFRAASGGLMRAADGRDFRGREHFYGIVPLDYLPKGLVVLVGLDRELALAPARRELYFNAIVAAVVVAFAFVAAWLVGRRLIERPIRSLVETAQRHADGDLGARFAGGRDETELGKLAIALNGMAAAIERLVAQKNLLVREVQHRVMNSLQLLGSFLHLQSRQVQDEAVKKHLQDARGRIVSMSAIYRHLYHSEATGTLEFAAVLHAFCTETGRAYLGGTGLAVSVDADPIELPMETALSLSLITHELITNAMKHAYPGATGGPLHVSLCRIGHNLELAVADEGCGLPDDFVLERTASLGMTVIQSLARQLGGSVSFERRAKGTRFAVVFPLTRDAPKAAMEAAPPVKPPPESARAAADALR